MDDSIEIDVDNRVDNRVDNPANYKFSDVDFFISSNNTDNIEKLIHTFWMDGIERTNKEGYSCKNIVSIYDSTNDLGKVNFQLSIIDCSNYPNIYQQSEVSYYIDKSFHIDVFKNYFDGRNFYSYHYNDILTKTTTIQGSNQTSKDTKTDLHPPAFHHVYFLNHCLFFHPAFYLNRQGRHETRKSYP